MSDEQIDRILKLLSGETLSVKPTLRIGNEPPMALESVQIEIIPADEHKQETWHDREPLF